ncbi:glycosyltransferase family 4 protein [Ornithinimicrobium pekingense]|uniref:Undecaprenyl-phosphate alpha-N-acetylglucosaminyl 1-phosphate transferase n=1 Tax=Ornithinimicrobium pekingense TaxID=384677 RepID=A0ABQ2F4Z6_9MICO|nr:MraY family glycosyltransferase [Ornithinimicrobium pekingense]GGK59845.1 undecaprenyl-phosphate alpha-N-acetylglucosaminyl 1-phosphate transferase [Ornithinimicrobium pekingense]
MREFLMVLLTAAVVTYLATPLVRRLALATGALTAVRDRDVHTVPIPRLGGVAMLVGFAAAVALGEQLPYLGQLFDSSPQLWGVLLAATIITVLGALDDVRELDWMTKLAGQVIAGGVMAFFGVQLLSLPIGGVTVLPEPVMVTLTILVVVISTNAVNFIDGLDGLAAGVVLIAAAAFFGWSYLVSTNFDPPNVFSMATFISAALIGVCAGFLPHNFHPARLFMGDAGALLLGLLLAAATISMTGSVDPSSSLASASAAAAILLPIAMPLAIMGLPFVDMLLAVLRRTRAGQLPWKPDRGHLHHRMLDIGHSHRRAVVLLYLWAGLIAVGAVSFAYLPPWVSALGILLLVVVATVLTRRPWNGTGPSAGGKVPPPAVSSDAQGL